MKKLWVLNYPVETDHIGILLFLAISIVAIALLHIQFCDILYSQMCIFGRFFSLIDFVFDFNLLVCFFGSYQHRYLKWMQHFP